MLCHSRSAGLEPREIITKHSYVATATSPSRDQSKRGGSEHRLDVLRWIDVEGPLFHVVFDACYQL